MPGVLALRYATAVALGHTAEASDAAARLAGYARQVMSAPSGTVRSASSSVDRCSVAERCTHRRTGVRRAAG